MIRVRFADFALDEQKALVQAAMEALHSEGLASTETTIAEYLTTAPVEWRQRVLREHKAQQARAT